MANKQNRFGQGYNMREKPSRGEELDQRFGIMVVRMHMGVEAFQANDRVTSDKIRVELDAEIKALDDKVQREIAGYVQTLTLDEIVPVATLHYAGPIGRSYLKLAKLALVAKSLGFTVNSESFRDSIIAIAEGKDNERIVKALVDAGRFEKAREIKTGAFAAEIREAAPKSWFKQLESAPKTGELEARGITAAPAAETAAETAFDPDPQDIAGAEAALAASTETGTRRSRQPRKR